VQPSFAFRLAKAKTMADKFEDESSFAKATEDKERPQPDDSSWGATKKEDQDGFFHLARRIIVI
jgi:hypothetical protein